MKRLITMVSSVILSLTILFTMVYPVYAATPTNVFFSPTNGEIGDVIEISGRNFTGATTVKFNDIIADTVTDVTDSSLRATVPVTATSGKITVITPEGSGKSIDNFTVWTPKSLDITVDPGVGYVGALSGIALDYHLYGSENYAGTINFDATGRGTIYNIRPGTYTLNLSGAHWLRRTILHLDLSISRSVVASMTNGDADGGNSVNLFDLVVLDAHFGSSYSKADLDGSGIVNLFDYVLVDNLFGSKGDDDGLTMINPVDGADMVWVPAGEFIMGNPNGHFPWEEMPQRTVYLDGYWMYQNEVTTAQYRAFCLATTHPMPTEPTWGWQDTHPMVNVTWHDAVSYASWAGAALPTEAQWEKASRGNDGRQYPWGDTWDVTKCANLTSSGISTKPVGSYPTGASPYGCLDMAGNVWEWCSDWYLDVYYVTAPFINPVGPVSGSYRILRGGSWFNGDSSDFRCSRRHYKADIGTENMGFRCARP